MPRTSRSKLSHSKTLFWAIILSLGLLSISAVWSYSYFQSRDVSHLYVQDIPESNKFPTPTSSTAQTTLDKTPHTLTATAASTQSAEFALPILMYHYVEHVKDPKDTIRKKLDTLPETLDSDLKTLQQAGYTFLFASDVADGIDGKKILPPKSVVLTFDDGYRDFYTDAFPILEKYHAKATAYIISGFIGKPNYMFLPQLLEIQQSGLVEIGAHTIHHVDLSRANRKLAETEIIQSKLQLEKLLNVPVVSFAYPDGRYNDQAIAIVQNAGFTNAVSTKPGIMVSQSNRFSLYRFRPGGRNGPALINFLKKVTNS